MNPQMPPSHPNLPTERAPAQFTTSLTSGERDEQEYAHFRHHYSSNGFGPVIAGLAIAGALAAFFFFFFASAAPDMSATVETVPNTVQKQVDAPVETVPADPPREKPIQAPPH